jgi:hypothetical protein
LPSSCQNPRQIHASPEFRCDFPDSLSNFPASLLPYRIEMLIK